MYLFYTAIIWFQKYQLFKIHKISIIRWNHLATLRLLLTDLVMKTRLFAANCYTVRGSLTPPSSHAES